MNSHIGFYEIRKNAYLKAYGKLTYSETFLSLQNTLLSILFTNSLLKRDEMKLTIQ